MNACRGLESRPTTSFSERPKAVSQIGRQNPPFDRSWWSGRVAPWDCFSLDYKQPPLSGDTAKKLRTAIVEPDTRPCHQIFNGGRDKEFASFCGRGNASSNMNGDAAYSPFDHLALVSMNARSESDSQISDALDDVARTCHGLGRNVKGSEKTVTGGVYLMAAEYLKVVPHDCVMPCKKLLPRTIPEGDGQLRRSDNISKQNRVASTS